MRFLCEALRETELRLDVIWQSTRHGEASIDARRSAQCVARLKGRERLDEVSGERESTIARGVEIAPIAADGESGSVKCEASSARTDSLRRLPPRVRMRAAEAPG